MNRVHLPFENLFYWIFASTYLRSSCLSFFPSIFLYLFSQSPGFFSFSLPLSPLSQLACALSLYISLSISLYLSLSISLYLSLTFSRLNRHLTVFVAPIHWIREMICTCARFSKQPLNKETIETVGNLLFNALQIYV